MTATINRGTRTALAVLAFLPTLFAALAVRPLPANADGGAFGFFAVDLRASGVGFEGELGAGGGLTPVDPGVAIVQGRIDSSPSTSITSSSLEPGTLYRTVAAVANDSAGQEVVPAPLAAAHYPGEAEGNADLAGEQDFGAFRAAGLTARATADLGVGGGSGSLGSLTTVDAPVTAARLWRELDALRLAWPGVLGSSSGRSAALLDLQGVTATVDVQADAATGTITATGRSITDRAVVLGEIQLEGVVGQAAVSVGEAGRIVAADVAVASATIAGVGVEITDQGVVVADTEVVGAADVEAFNRALNDALSQAGLSLHLAAPINEQPTERTAVAESRGVRVGITTPTLADGGVPANEIALVLGGARVAAVDEAAAIAVDLPLDTTLDDASLPSAPSTGSSPGGTAIATAPSLGSSSTGVGATGPAEPVVAPPAADQAGTPLAAAPVPAPPLLLVAGETWDAKTALAALGAWQLLSLGGTSAAILYLRRRALEVA